MPRPGAPHAAAKGNSRESPAAALAHGPRDEGGLLARTELVAEGQALVSPCQSGHRDLPGALRMVHGAGAAAPAFVLAAGHDDGQRLSRALRVHPEPAVDPDRCDVTTPLRLRQCLRDDA